MKIAMKKMQGMNKLQSGPMPTPIRSASFRQLLENEKAMVKKQFPNAADDDEWYYYFDAVGRLTYRQKTPFSNKYALPWSN